VCCIVAAPSRSAMNPRLAIAALLAGLAVIASTAAAAATPAGTLVDRLGEQAVTLPVPAGFAPAEGAAATMRDILARALPPNYRLISLQVPQDYLDKQRAHEATGALSRYVSVLTYRNYETSGMTPALFDAVKTALREQSDKVMKLAETQTAGAVDKMSKDIAQRTGDATTSMKVGATTSLGVFEEHPDSFALATVGPVSISSRKLNETHDQVAVVAVVLVHGKPINANFYSDYASQADLEWAKGLARDWIRRVAELNP